MSNFGQIVANVTLRLAESSSAPVAWSQDDIKAAVNEGYLDFCEQTRMVEREAEIRTVQGLPYMDMRQAFAYPFLGVRRLYARASSRTLMPSSVKARDDRDIRWAMGSGLIQRFFMRGLYVLGFWPVPTTREQMRASITSLPDPMVNDEDEPEIAEEFHDGIELYALYALKCMETEVDVALGYWKIYLTVVELGISYAEDQIKTSRDFIMGQPEPRATFVRIGGRFA